MMLSPLLVVAVALAQVADGEPAAVVAPANTSELGKRLEAQLTAALKAGGVPLMPATAAKPAEAAACETNRQCFALLGRVLGAFAIVRIEGAAVGADVAVLVEAIDPATGKVFREESFVVPNKAIEAEVAPRLASLSARVLAAVPLPKPKPIVLVADEPLRPPPPIALTAEPPPPAKSAVPIWATGTGAIVMAGAGATLLGMSVSARGCLSGPPVEGHPTVCVPQAQARAMQQQADVTAVVGTAAGAVAVGLAVTALIQHLTN